MPDPISDANLGSRFWLVTDYSPLNPAEAPAPQNPAVAKVKHDSTILTFVDAGGDSMAQSAIHRAELFAASHTLAGAEAHEAQRAQANAGRLLGEDAIDAFIDSVAEAYAARLEDGTTADDVRGFCRTAVLKLMVTREIDARAKWEEPVPGGPPQPVRLTAAGLNALRNAAMGLADMLKNHRISENAVVALADGKYYDASNRADLLRLSADSAAKVKELFIGKERFDALIRQCEESLARLEAAGTLTAARKVEIEADIARLRQLAQDAMELRAAAVANIKTDYLLTDPTGRVKSDHAFQKQQLEQIRDSLRAFRYDLDRVSGKRMSFMESVRRKFDELRSSIDGQRIGPAEYDAMRQADSAFNSLLGRIQYAVLGGAQVNDLGAQDTYGLASGEVAWGAKISLAESAAAATQFSHLTNDRIRYHYSGAESREAANFAAIQEELGNIAENGGSRSVTLRAGVDALFELGLFGVDFKAKAGGSIDVSAQIKADNPDGTVSITYSVGVQAKADASTRIGVDPKEKDAEAGGFGAQLSGKVSAGVTRSVTKTYANLEEAARTMSRLNLVMTPRPREVFYAWGSAMLQGIGHVFVLGATSLGFRIHRSRMDQVAYGAELRNRNVLGGATGIFLKKRNVEVLGERTAWTIKGGMSVKANGGLYVPGDAGEPMASNLEFDASAGGEYSREVSASGKTYESFMRSLAGCSAAYLEGLLADERVELGNSPWQAALHLSVASATGGNVRAIRDALGSLATRLAELEESAIGKGQGDRAFWQDFAAKARLLAVATALLAKRAEALDGGAEGAAEGAAEAKKAAQAAVAYILPRLANPVVKVPTAIFQEQFFNVFDLTSPRVSRKVITVSAGYNALNDLEGQGIEKLGMGDEIKVGDGIDHPIAKGAAQIGGAVGGPALDGMANMVKDTTGLSGRYEVRITSERIVSQHKDPRPWLNSGKVMIDVRLHANLPLRAIIDVVARHYIKSAGGLTDLDEAKWKEEFKDGIVDGLKNAGEDVAMEGASRILDLPFLEAAKQYPVLSQMIGGIDALNSIRKNGVYEFTDDTFKTLRFEFGSGGRFGGFSLAEDYDTEGALKVSVQPFLQVTASISSKTSVNDWVVMPRPTPNTLMKRAADYDGAGNPEGFARFLARNRKGVARLVRIGRYGAAPDPADTYWQKDANTLAKIIGDCGAILTRLEGEGSLQAEQARKLREDFEAVSERLKGQAADLAVDDCLALAADFFSAAARIYTLAAMFPPPAQ